MLLGHYGIALAAKRAAPRTSLGTLNLAAQLLDELWPIFVLMGLETVRVAPGLMAANPLDFVHYPITHSLVGALGWSVLLGVVYLAMTRYRRGAVVVGLLVLSHWFLDLPMHRADLPLWPGSDVRVG
ncbi:MAG: metal-dependent hydrolase, partial [Gemmatimonadota bacterium]|nr:metal-dependent hydrolase [Gemmatimonadota bacterium]